MLKKEVAQKAQEKQLLKIQKDFAQFKEECKTAFATKEEVNELRESHDERLRALEELIKSLEKELNENKWQEGRVASLEDNERKLKKEIDDLTIDLNMLKDKLKALL